MATIDVEIAARRYSVACRDGEEEHLRSVAEIVDRKAQQATQALGSLSEVRQLLFACLLLADEVKEHRAGNPVPPDPETDPRVADALARLAERMERLAQRLETGAASA
ncbi:MAG TPA: cell division protein ZapA [Allosphingosinicella sp.]|jgi:cell division protein ZapA|nr:cell division protein ZapA [Allosphingosinicella sp.]